LKGRVPKKPLKINCRRRILQDKKVQACDLKAYEISVYLWLKHIILEKDKKLVKNLINWKRGMAPSALIAETVSGKPSHLNVE